MTRPTILILIGALWPGNDASGPNLSIRAQCEALAGRFDFRIVARDRPFGAPTALTTTDRWHDLGFAKARYLSVGRTGAKGLTRLLRATPHDLLVLNGFFDREFTLPALVAHRFGRIRRVPVLLSPRGEFTGGALSLKAGPKTAFRKIAAVTRLHRRVHFHATSDAELADVRAILPGQAVTLVPNFRPLFPLPPHVARGDEQPFRLAFLGRISPVKGLDVALRAIAAAQVPVQFDIFGPIADVAHWTECQALIAAMPPMVHVEHHGEIANDAAAAMLAAHDALLLPSLSENFGHAIFESLASGTPVIIGDRTPWRGLAAVRAGYDSPVGDVGAFARIIRQLAGLPAAESLLWRAGARAVAESHARDSSAREAMAALFTALINGKSA